MQANVLTYAFRCLSSVLWLSTASWICYRRKVLPDMIFNNDVRKRFKIKTKFFRAGSRFAEWKLTLVRGTACTGSMTLWRVCEKLSRVTPKPRNCQRLRRCDSPRTTSGLLVRSCALARRLTSWASSRRSAKVRTASDRPQARLKGFKWGQIMSSGLQVEGINPSKVSSNPSKVVVLWRHTWAEILV